MTKVSNRSEQAKERTVREVVLPTCAILKIIAIKLATVGRLPIRLFCARFFVQDLSHSIFNATVEREFSYEIFRT